MCFPNTLRPDEGKIFMRIQCRQRWQIFQCFYLFSMKLVKVESETYKTQKEAEDRKKEIEYKQSVGKFEVPKCVTLRELLDEYVKIYGLAKWSMSTYDGNFSLINNYILPSPLSARRRKEKIDET